MTPKPLKNTSASIRQRLLNHAKAHGDDYQRILTRYAIERLLFRLSQTEAREGYILKGAMLFVTWPEQVFRPTGDLDLLPSLSAVSTCAGSCAQLLACALRFSSDAGDPAEDEKAEGPGRR